MRRSIPVHTLAIFVVGILLGCLVTGAATPRQPRYAMAQAAEPERNLVVAEVPLDWAAMTAAARETARQVDFFQQVMISDPTLSNINGLWGQTADVKLAVGEFRELVRGKASRDKIYLGYDKIERRIKGVLEVIQNIKNGHPSIQMAAQALQSASFDLHFAVMGSDGDAKPQAEVLYRQTLNALACNENLKGTIVWLYAEREPLKPWTADLKAVRQALDAFQQLQQNKAAVKDLKEQFLQLDKAWDRVVRRYKDTPVQEQYLLVNRVAREDQLFGRLAKLLGINDRRAALSDTVSD